MFVKKIFLQNFRNYDNLQIDFDSEFNIIFGDNAQGKTNIIEALFLCAVGRSHRTSKDIELVRRGETGYYVKVEFEKDTGEALVEVAYSKEEKKKIKINEIPAKKIGSLMGHLNIVIFSPEDLFIIKEGPSERRRFLDITLSQLKPSYFYDLQQYSKILAQRNMLLKEISVKKELIATLDVWNQHLVKTGSRIMRARNEFIDRMDKSARERHNSLTKGSENLKIIYVPSIESSNMCDLKEIENSFQKKLAASYNREIQKCTTLYGPQRDDYDILLNQMSTKQYGSQGQQRTSVLSMKLSEIDIMKEVTGENPVLLLDDVLSELDAKRQEYLFENIKEIQTFITCTDKNLYGKEKKHAKYLNIINGKVKE